MAKTLGLCCLKSLGKTWKNHGFSGKGHKHNSLWKPRAVPIMAPGNINDSGTRMESKFYCRAGPWVKEFMMIYA